jgi:hypothetical protein
MLQQRRCSRDPFAVRSLLWNSLSTHTRKGQARTAATALCSQRSEQTGNSSDLAIHESSERSTVDRRSCFPVRVACSTAVGRKIEYRDTDRSEWVDAMIRAGVPADYGAVLRSLTETIANGHGSRPNGDVLAATCVAPTRFAEFASKTAPAWR